MALEVLAHDDGAPTWLRTNVGLAVADGDGTYSYVCPSRWDGNELARAVMSPDGEQLLVHSYGVAYLSRDGGCTFEPVTGDELYVASAEAIEGGFVLIADDYPDDPRPDSCRIFVLGHGGLEERDLALPGPIDGVMATAAGYLVTGASFVADDTGAVRGVDVGATRLTPRAVAESGALWLHASADGESWLVHVDGDAIEAGARYDVIHGPIRIGERWIAMLDGVVHERVEDGWAPLDETAWTCLQTHRGQGFACSLAGTYALAPGASMPEAELVFTMRQLGPPRACGDETAVRACESDWTHFGGEAGWLETEPARSPSEARRPPSTCAAGPGARGARSWILVMVVLSLALAGRRR